MLNSIKPTIITGQQWGQKVTVEIDHSDLDFNEMFMAFRTITIGLGWGDEVWKNTIMEFAESYKEEEAENEKLDELLD